MGTEPDALDIAWCAGFIDGEGSMFVTLDKSRPWGEAWGIQTRVDQTQEEATRKLQATLGGHVMLRSSKTATGRPIWRWQLQGATQHRVAIPLILPHLVVKRGKARLLLDFCDTVIQRGTRLTPEILALRHELRERIRKE